MIWTLILFGITLFVLWKYAFPRIGEALEKRANAIRENIEAAEKQREEADELLAEYRQRLKEAREQAEDIVARARKASEAAVAEATAEGKAKREELVAAARRDIEAETQALARPDPQGGRGPDRARDREGDPQVARRRRPEAAGRGGARRGRLLRPGRQRGLGGAELARWRRLPASTPTPCSRSRKDKDELDEIHDQLGEFADAMNASSDMRSFFFSPYFSSAEKREGIRSAVSGPARSS